MKSSYKTIKREQTTSIKIKSSKFIAFAYPIENEEEIKGILKTLKKQFSDANHICFAYFLGVNQEKSRAFDDGEPKNTAGNPILRQLQKLELTNTFVAIVRYFGGTLLGVSGLIEAYSATAAECLTHCEIIEEKIYDSYEMNCEFGCEKDFFLLLKQFECIFKVIHKDDFFCVKIKISLPESNLFISKTKEIKNIAINKL